MIHFYKSFARSGQSAENLSSEIQADLIALGFILADEKCQWKPSQEFWLGLVWNTEIKKTSESNHRIQKLKGNIQNILKCYASGIQVV